MKKILFSTLKILGIWAFWIAIWWIAAEAVDLSLLLPSPTQTLVAMGELLSTSLFWEHLLLSLLRVLAGILISLAIGTILAVLTTKVALARTLIAPLIHMIKSVPVASFIVLACLWMNSASLPILITSLIVIPVVWSNVSLGIEAVEPELVQVASVFGFSPIKKLTRLYIPTVFPHFLASCRSAIGMAWKAGIAAEILAPPLIGIGKAMYIAKTNLESAPLFAWTLVIVLVSFITEKILMWVLKKSAIALRWSKGGAKGALT